MELFVIYFTILCAGALRGRGNHQQGPTDVAYPMMSGTNAISELLWWVRSSVLVAVSRRQAFNLPWFPGDRTGHS